MPEETQATNINTVNFAPQGPTILTWKIIFPEKKKKKHDKTEKTLLTLII